MLVQRLSSPQANLEWCFVWTSMFSWSPLWMIAYDFLAASLSVNGLLAIQSPWIKAHDCLRNKVVQIYKATFTSNQILFKSTEKGISSSFQGNTCTSKQQVSCVACLWDHPKISLKKWNLLYAVLRSNHGQWTSTNKHALAIHN